jgi:hypothetical protein
MAINPVPGIGNAEQTQSAPGDSRVEQTQAPAQSVEHSAETNSGAAPESETHRPSAFARSSELPEDEVQLQRDPETNGDVVIKYLDHSGSLVLQVPSSQVLGVARSIIQEFAQAAARVKAEAASPESSSENVSEEIEGGDHHGH